MMEMINLFDEDNSSGGSKGVRGRVFGVLTPPLAIHIMLKSPFLPMFGKVIIRFNSFLFFFFATVSCASFSVSSTLSQLHPCQYTRRFLLFCLTLNFQPSIESKWRVAVDGPKNTNSLSLFLSPPLDPYSISVIWISYSIVVIQLQMKKTKAWWSSSDFSFQKW